MKPLIASMIFVLAALAQWAGPLWQIYTYEQTLTHGTLIKLKCTAPDPYDPLRGRYLAVRPAQQEIKVTENPRLREGVAFYASFTIGDDGLATLSEVSLTPPEKGESIRLRSRDQVQGNSVWIDWPFERFYLNEKLAPEADLWLAENIRSAQGVVAEVRVLHGKAVLADLSLDGKSFREILKTRVK
jgi:uncharacterized membrane-anchored protein